MKENLSGVRLVPHTFGEAGGGATEFIVPADKIMTFSRLFRRKDGYRLGVLTGITRAKELAVQNPTIRSRPLIFVNHKIDIHRFFQTFGSNHLLGVAGNFKEELKTLSQLLGIEYLDYDLTEGNL